MQFVGKVAAVGVAGVGVTGSGFVGRRGVGVGRADAGDRRLVEVMRFSALDCPGGEAVWAMDSECVGLAHSAAGSASGDRATGSVRLAGTLVVSEMDFGGLSAAAKACQA